MAYIISSGDFESGIVLEIDTMTLVDGSVATITTVNPVAIPAGENLLAVEVDSQSDDGSISSVGNEVTIDTTAPVITLSADTETVVLQTTLTATVDDGSTIQYRIGEFGLWKEYKEPIIASLNETYYFMAMDDAGNIGTNQITFGNIDTSGVLLSTLWSQRGINPMGGNTTLGKGSTFTVTIFHVKISDAAPVEDEDATADLNIVRTNIPQPGSAAAAKVEKPGEPAGAVGSKRILIVDDQKVNLMVLKAMLKKLGSGTVDVAASFLGNIEASLMYGNVMNFDLSDMLQAFLKKYVSGEKMRLYKNEIKGIRAIEWAGFPQALVVSNEGVRCESAEDKLTEIKALLDFVQSRG